MLTAILVFRGKITHFIDVLLTPCSEYFTSLALFNTPHGNYKCSYTKPLEYVQNFLFNFHLRFKKNWIRCSFPQRVVVFSG